jgi:hypothetical protein
MSLSPEQRLRKAQLLRELADLESAEAQVTAPPEEVVSASAAAVVPRRTGRSMRDLVLDALSEIGFTCYAQQLMLYIKARFGREFNPTRFGTLSVDEERAFARGTSRPVWLSHGLTFDRAEPVKRLWSRSDWPLETRLVTPAFGRAQYLRAAAKFSELAMEADTLAADPNLMRYLAADHARDLGVVVKHGEFKLAEWRDLALAQLATVEEKESGLLTSSARELAKTLEGPELLFGRKQKPVLFAVPQHDGRLA